MHRTRYGYRFCKRGYQCQECFGSGENEGYFERLKEQIGSADFGLTPYTLLCETCGGKGWLTGKDFKTAFGVSPSAAGVRAAIVSI